MSVQETSDSGAASNESTTPPNSAPEPQPGAETAPPGNLSAYSETMTATLETEANRQGPGKEKKNKATKFKLQVAHQTPGRVRMKVPSAKGNPDLLREIGEAFGVIPGIERVTVNATTGSVILHYDTDDHAAVNNRLTQRFLSENPAWRAPATEFDDLARKIESEADFLASHSESAKAVVDFFKHLDREIKIASGNVVDLKILLAVGIIGLTVFEIGASAATPVWLTLTIFSLNHVIELQQPRVQNTPAPAPVIFKTA